MGEVYNSHKMSEPKQSSLGLLVLLYLSQGPAHAYGLHKQMKDMGKDRVVNLRSRTSVYQVMRRLERDGLITPAGTTSAGGYSDRTNYQITDRGRTIATAWLDAMLASTGEEFPEFSTALSVLFLLPPEEAQSQLETRRDRLRNLLAEAEAAINGAPDGLPRLFLLDELHRQTILTAELAWTESLITELANSSLTWTAEWIAQLANNP